MQLGNRSDGAVPQGDFALLRVLGESGSDVFQARSADGRDVVLRFWRSLNELDARNAIEIANRARGVRHPMLACVFGVREHVDGTLSLVSEYVAGRTLDAWVADSGRPALRMVVDFVRRLALGLDAAVQRGLTHHAVYPGNILVAEPDTKPQGRIVAKLVDLGVAVPRRALRFEVAHFLAPEELSARLERGRPVPVTAAMNVYSCGCLLHYLCTGQPPFQSDTLVGLTALHAAGAIAVPSQVNRDIPEHLERVIARALERDPKKRIPTPAVLAAALSHVESVWRSSGVVRKSAVPPPPPAAKTRRQPPIPASDWVLPPTTAPEPRSAVVAKRVEAAGRSITREIPQLFQRPARRPADQLPGRTTLVGGFELATPLGRETPLPDLADDRTETVRQRIATAREFAALRPAPEAAQQPLASAVDRVVRVPDSVTPSREAVESAETDLTPDESVEVVELGGSSLEEIVESAERQAQPERQPAPASPPRLPPVPPRALGWPFAVPTPRTAAVVPPPSASGAQSNPEPRLLPRATPASIDPAKHDRSPKLCAARNYGRIPSMFGRPPVAPPAKTPTPAPQPSAPPTAATLAASSAVTDGSAAVIEGPAAAIDGSSVVVDGSAAVVATIDSTAPAIGSATPAIDSATPAIGSATPAIDSAARMTDGSPPGVDSAAPPLVDPPSPPALDASAPTLEMSSAAVLEVSSAPALELASAPVLEASSAPVSDAASVPVLDASPAAVLEVSPASVLEASSAGVVEGASSAPLIAAAPSIESEPVSELGRVIEGVPICEAGPVIETAGASDSVGTCIAAPSDEHATAEVGAAELESFFDPHETTTAVGGAVLVASRARSSPPPLPNWSAPDSPSIGSTSRDSLSPYEVPSRESRVSPREDVVFRTAERPLRTTRRWRWIAAAGVGLGAYVSLLALNHEPPEHHAASQPTTEHTFDITRAEGQRFPLIAGWKPALAPAPEPPPPPPPPHAPEPVAEAPARATDNPRADESASSKPMRPTTRTADSLLESMQVSAERAGIQARSAPRAVATRETLVVNLPSSPLVAPPVVTRGRIPAAPQPVVIGQLWATPSVVQAADLRPPAMRNGRVAQPSIQVNSGSQANAAARTENLEVRGSLSHQTVRRAIDRIRPQLNECFAQHAAASQTAATVRVELTIDETGRTRDAHVSGVSSGALDECLVQASRKLVAGAPDTGTVKVAWTVRYRR